MQRYRSRDGCYVVETVRLSGTPDRHDGEWIRVIYCSTWVADVRTILDLERYIALTELIDDDGVRHRIATRTELARRGATMGPPARPAPQAKRALAAHLRRLRLAYC